MPAVPPNSSTTTARWLGPRWKSRSWRSSVLPSGTNAAGRMSAVHARRRLVGCERGPACPWRTGRRPRRRDGLEHGQPRMLRAAEGASTWSRLHRHVHADDVDPRRHHLGHDHLGERRKDPAEHLALGCPPGRRLAAERGAHPRVDPRHHAEERLRRIAPRARGAGTGQARPGRARWTRAAVGSRSPTTQTRPQPPAKARSRRSAAAGPTRHGRGRHGPRDDQQREVRQVEAAAPAAAAPPRHPRSGSRGSVAPRTPPRARATPPRAANAGQRRGASRR